MTDPTPKPVKPGWRAVRKNTLAMLVVGLAFGLALGLVITYIPAFAPPEALFVSTKGAGVSRTKDGKSWEFLRIGMENPKTARTLAWVMPSKETITAKLMEAGAGLERPPDLEDVKEALLSVATLRPGLLAGMTDGRVLRLDDDRWTQVAKLPSEGGGVFRLRFHPAVGLAACTGRGLFLSRDGGENWEQITSDVTCRDVLLSPDPARRFLVGLYGGGLLRCNAKGACETITKNPRMIRRLAGDAASRNGFVGTDQDGFWRFEGDNLEQISNPALDNADILDVVSVGARVIVAAGPHGILIRDDAESGWRPGKDLPPDSITAVAIFKGKVFAGTNRYGLFSAPIGKDRFSPLP